MALEGRIKIDVEKKGGLLGEPKTAMVGGGIAGGIGKGGGIGDIVGGIGKLLGPLLIIAGAVTMMVKSSAMLQGALKGIGKILMLILRPIGDILGMALIPLLYVLKPVGVFFNTLMRPYIRKAMAAMRAGGALMKAGKPEEAMGAFVTGAEFLLKPFLDVSVKVAGEMMGGFADLLAAIPGVGDAFKGMGDVIRSGAQSFIDTTTNMLDVQLGMVLGQAEASTGKSMFNVVKSLEDAEVTTGYVSGLIKGGITTNLEDTKDWVMKKWPGIYGIILAPITDLQTDAKTEMETVTTNIESSLSGLIPYVQTTWGVPFRLAFENVLNSIIPKTTRIERPAFSYVPPFNWAWDIGKAAGEAQAARENEELISKGVIPG